MARLDAYRAKRDFGRTAEPKGAERGAKKTKAPAATSALSFVVHKHAARRLHYDLRLEHEGALWSFAVTRGPSLDPSERRLAVRTEDHPLSYREFEGVIPAGEYGGGAMVLWDRGTWEPEGDAAKGMAKGHIAFTLAGEKLHGRWHLVRLKARSGEKRENWLLMKSDDDAAREDVDVLEAEPRSVLSGLTVEELAAGAKPARPAGVRPLSRTRKPDTAPTPPAFIQPMLATLQRRPPAGAAWLHEVKFDGYRVQARIEGGDATLLTRTGLDWTDRFGETLAGALAALPVANALIDGEVTALADGGVSSFSALQESLSAGDTARLVYFAFDLLFVDGEDLRAAPLLERKARLRKVLPREIETGPLRFSEHFDQPGDVMLEHACRLGLEGVISKRVDAAYRSGRGPTWIKSKCTDRQEFVITGYVPSGATGRDLGSITVGWRKDGALTPAGRVGTGFTRASAQRLKTALDAIRTETSPYAGKAGREKGVVWVRPELVAEVEFRGVTPTGALRHASFQGLRDDKPADEVVAEQVVDTPEPAEPPAPSTRPRAPRNAASPAPAPETPGKRRPKAAAGPAVPAANVRLTNPDKVLWPDPGVTKRGLLDHYAAVWERMRPHVVERPLSLVRAPDGVGGQTFFQKHASPGMPAQIRRMKDQTGEELLFIEDFDGLAALVQIGTVEIHVWGSHVATLETPDLLVFDLDPGPGVSPESVRTATLDVRDRLAELDLSSYVKTSGGKGFHVMVPILPSAGWDRAKTFCREFAKALAAADPGGFTATLAKKARGGRIFIDYLRNGRGATAVAAFSTRARPGAAISAPVKWAELERGVAPDRYRVGDLPPQETESALRAKRGL